jgi:UDP-N-acetylglucosamine diphosphorylase / glucose-1-phosphate thymidylyltransferase / UDP-N-acetylgalactosamine diphosphorylase / glucosamine-1-phosphate N-acetyltransferase / galactosamine-1-phosphate N-acetyltransferase
MFQPIRQAVLMAAGAGKRLRPLTDDRPKPMIRIGGRPILEWTIDSLPQSIEEIIIVVGYLKEQIMNHFGNEWGGRKIKYVIQEDLKGTGHVVHVAAPLLDDRFMILNGDDLYLREDLERLTEHELAILGLQVESNGRFGLLAISTDGHLSGASDDTPQGSAGMINVGAYVLDRNFLDYELVPIGDGSEFGLPQTIGAMANERSIDVVEATAWLPIGFPEDVEKASDWLKQYRNKQTA